MRSSISSLTRLSQRSRQSHIQPVSRSPHASGTPYTIHADMHSMRDPTSSTHSLVTHRALPPPPTPGSLSAYRFPPAPPFSNPWQTIPFQSVPVDRHPVPPHIPLSSSNPPVHTGIPAAEHSSASVCVPHIRPSRPLPSRSTQYDDVDVDMEEV